MAALCLSDRLLLAALALEARYSGSPESRAGGAIRRAQDLFGLGGIAPPPEDVLLGRLAELGRRRLVLLDGLRARLRARAALNVPTRDLVLALCADPALEFAHQAVRACGGG